MYMYMYMCHMYTTVYYTYMYMYMCHMYTTVYYTYMYMYMWLPANCKCSSGMQSLINKSDDENACGDKPSLRSRPDRLRGGARVPIGRRGGHVDVTVC